MTPESVFLAFTEHKEIDGKIVEKQISRDYKMKESYDIFELDFEFNEVEKEFMRHRKRLGTVFSNSLTGNEGGIWYATYSAMRVDHTILKPGWNRYIQSLDRTKLTLIFTYFVYKRN